MSSSGSWKRPPHELKDLFREWLAAHYPDRARHVMSRVQSIRGGRDNAPSFDSRMAGSGVDAALLKRRFEVATRRLGLDIRMRVTLDAASGNLDVSAGSQSSIDPVAYSGYS
jgi:DNA repair photolyase